MVTCSPVADGGRWKEGQAEEELQPRKASSPPSSPSCSSRTLVYVVETGSLRYSKPSRDPAATLNSWSPKSPCSPASSFKLELSTEHLGEVDSLSRSPPCTKLHCEGFPESDESSPTCVIQNSARRSNSSSPTMSTISKASSDTSGRSFPGTKLLDVAIRSPVELDEEIVNSGARSPKPEPQKVGEVRERVKKLESINTTSGRPGLKGQLPRRVEGDSSTAKENAGWSTMPHEQSKDPTQNPPFKSIQCAVADNKTLEAGMKKPKHGGIPVSRLADSSAVQLHKRPGVFNFNATYMPRAADSDLDSDFSDKIHCHTTPTIATTTTANTITTTITATPITPKVVAQQQLDLSRRTFLTPLLKPTPSKWDDAEKWLPGSECQSARAKSRSGPLLAQMVAAQAGMSIPWKGPQIVLPSQTERHYTVAGVAVGQRGEEAGEGDSSGSETVDVKDIQTQATPTSAPGMVDFTADEKEQLSLLLDRYAVQNVASGEYVQPSDGSTSPSHLNGSFLKLGARMEKPVAVDFSPASGDYDSKKTLEVDSKPNFIRVATRDMGTTMTEEGVFKSNDALDLDSKPDFTRVATRDMGTAMTPIPSVEPSRTSTPLRATSHQRPDDGAGPPKPKKTTTTTTTTAESPMTEKEFQEKTRQEIVALGTQLGKASIAAAWAARERENEESSAVVRRSSSTLDLENLRRDVFASRADAWQDAEKAKYSSRFEQEKAKIQAWEEHEKAKAEAEMRRIELKAERMKSQAHEKLSQKLATTQRQAEQLRVAAETRRAEAAAKAARKADVLKTNGKITNLLFLSLLCT